MPIRSGAMQRPSGCRCGNTLRQRYDEVGLPCSSTMGSPSPTSTYAISMPRTRRRCFLYGNAAEIMLAPPSWYSDGVGLQECLHCGGNLLRVGLQPEVARIEEVDRRGR